MSENDTRTPRLSRRQFVAASGMAGATLLGGGAVVGAQQSNNQVRIAGSSTVFPISTAVAEEFQRQNPDIQVNVSSTGTGGGFSNFFCAGETDINDASRPIVQEERQQCRGNDVTPIEFTVATDAITFVVNPEADWVDCVTTDELEQIWGPNGARRWSDVRDDWPDEPFELYGPTSASGTFDFFTEEVIGEEGAHRGDYQGTEQDNTIVQGVQGSRYAMGYFGFAFYDQNRDSVKALSVRDTTEDFGEPGGAGGGNQTGGAGGNATGGAGGNQSASAGAGANDSSAGQSGQQRAPCVEPSFQTAKSGRYRPLARPLYIYVARESLQRPPVRQFVRFYLNQTSTPLIRQVGYIPLTQQETQDNLQKFRQAVQAVQ